MFNNPVLELHSVVKMEYTALIYIHTRCNLMMWSHTICARAIRYGSNINI